MKLQKERSWCMDGFHNDQVSKAFQIAEMHRMYKTYTIYQMAVNHVR